MHGSIFTAEFDTGRVRLQRLVSLYPIPCQSWLYIPYLKWCTLDFDWVYDICCCSWNASHALRGRKGTDLLHECIPQDSQMRCWSSLLHWNNDKRWILILTEMDKCNCKRPRWRVTTTNESASQRSLIPSSNAGSKLAKTFLCKKKLWFVWCNGAGSTMHDCNLPRRPCNHYDKINDARVMKKRQLPKLWLWKMMPCRRGKISWIAR